MQMWSRELHGSSEKHENMCERKLSVRDRPGNVQHGGWHAGGQGLENLRTDQQERGGDRRSIGTRRRGDTIEGSGPSSRTEERLLEFLCAPPAYDWEPTCAARTSTWWHHALPMSAHAAVQFQLHDMQSECATVLNCASKPFYACLAAGGIALQTPGTVGDNSHVEVRVVVQQPQIPVYPDQPKSEHI